MARAGVEPGDVILRAGDAEVDEVGDLRRALADAGSEGKLRVDLVRQGNRRSVDLQWEPTHWRVVAPSARARQRADERERVEVRRQRVRERQARERAPSN